MSKSSYYLSKLTDIQNDMCVDIMKKLIDAEATKGVEIDTKIGKLKVGVAKSKDTGIRELKILHLEKKVAFSQFTINPNILAEILEKIEEEVVLA